MSSLIARAMNERTRAREVAERRALALKKLAKVFGTNGGDTDDGKAAYTAEKKILTEILRSTLEPDVVGLVRDRLAVLSARDDSEESDEDYDVVSGEPGAGRDRSNPKPADPRDLKTTFSKQWTAAALRDIAKGAREVPATLASGTFWEKLLVTHAPELEHLTARDETGTPSSLNDNHRSLWSTQDLRSETFDLHREIVDRGYAVVPRPEYFATMAAEIRRDAWTETLSRGVQPERFANGDANGDANVSDHETREVASAASVASAESTNAVPSENKPSTTSPRAVSLDDLADAMDALRRAGWPPVALFAFDAAWTAIDRLFPVAARALNADVGDVRLEPTCFAWALGRAVSAREASAAHAATAARAAAARPELRDAARGASLRDAVFFGSTDDGASRFRDAVARVGGDAFATPHRDYSAKEAWSNDAWHRGATGSLGTPKLVCVWVPLTDATLDAGCLHVVPRWSDRLFDDPDHPDHLRPAHPEADGGHALRFPAGAARAIPAEAGSVCVWAGQTIHYGSPCRLAARDLERFEGEDPVAEGLVRAREARGVPPARAPRRRRPRRSLACTFRVVEHSDSADPWGSSASGATHAGGGLPYLSRSACRDMTVAQRVRLIAQSLVLYSRWYDLPAHLPGLHDEKAGGFAGNAGEKTSFTAKTCFDGGAAGA